MELTDEERERIRLQEQYRLEITRSLEPKAPPPKLDTWSFLNSTFGLWLLTAIFITGVGGALSLWQHDRDVARAHDEQLAIELHAERQKQIEEQRLDKQKEESRMATVHKLDREISFRLSRLLDEFNTAAFFEENGETTYPGHAPKELRKVMLTRLFQPATVAGNDSLYPEYASYSLSTLVSELRNSLVTKKDLDEIDNIIRILAVWRHQRIGGAAGVDDLLFKTLVIPRWRHLGFPNTDCPEKKGFPC